MKEKIGLGAFYATQNPDRKWIEPILQVLEPTTH